MIISGKKLRNKRGNHFLTIVNQKHCIPRKCTAHLSIDVILQPNEDGNQFWICRNRRPDVSTETPGVNVIKLFFYFVIRVLAREEP